MRIFSYETNDNNIHRQLRFIGKSHYSYKGMLVQAYIVGLSCNDV